MTDYFALLGESRRPWLDPDSLKKKFLAVSAQLHPDHAQASSEAEKRKAQTHYAELNQAYNHLRSPKERLQHLLELEIGNKPEQITQVPAGLMDLFFTLMQVLKQTDEFLAQKTSTSSPLLQVELFEAGQGWIDKLKTIQQQLNSKQQELVAELEAIDAEWVPQQADAPERVNLLKRLEELYRLFGYYSKWENQIQERIVQLSF